MCITYFACRSIVQRLTRCTLLDVFQNYVTSKGVRIRMYVRVPILEYLTISKMYLPVQWSARGPSNGRSNNNFRNRQICFLSFVKRIRHRNAIRVEANVAFVRRHFGLRAAYVFPK